MASLTTTIAYLRIAWKLLECPDVYGAALVAFDAIATLTLVLPLSIEIRPLPRSGIRA
jgi:hypothetical protein